MTPSTAQAPPRTGPRSRATRRAKNSPGVTKYQRVAAEKTTATSATVPQASASRAGRRFFRARSDWSAWVRSPRMVWGQLQPHQTRPQTKVTSRKTKVRARVASRTTKNSSIQRVAPRKWRRRLPTSKRSALSPRTVTKGRPRKIAACAMPAHRRQGPMRRVVGPVPLLVVIEHLVLRRLDARLPLLREVVDDHPDQRRAEEQPEGQVHPVVAGDGLGPHGVAGRSATSRPCAGGPPGRARWRPSSAGP